MSHTLIVLSYEPLAILVSSNWTQEIPVKKLIIEGAVSQNFTKIQTVQTATKLSETKNQNLERRYK